jgi:glycosyltransferase involved in cell wall biosynthesis
VKKVKIESVLVLSPEPPYPMNGGGAFRIASLIHYFARFAKVDLILFSESGKPAIVPPGLLRSQTVIPLPHHSRSIVSRYIRNTRRAVQGTPPLIDRLAGHNEEIARAVSGKHYDLGIVEHLWAAPYLKEVAHACARTVLDLHNIESILHRRCAETSHGLIAAGQKRFAHSAHEIENNLLPQYSMVLATSKNDAALAAEIAHDAKIFVYPNALPETPAPQIPEQPVVVFSGNFEYHPNIDAVDFLMSSIWPEVHRECPELRLRLVGRGDKFIRHLLPSGLRVEVTGAVENALEEIAAARIVIAPLRTGSGTRIKILEAWAAARPVIATSVAAEGLECLGERDLIIANRAKDFGTAIARLNADPSRRVSLSVNGRRLFEEHYTWQAVWKTLDATLAHGTGTAHRYTEDSDANSR